MAATILRCAAGWRWNSGIPADWASVDQVHGAAVVQATEAGNLGEADATFTSRSGLALAVATADCVPVVIEGPDVAGVAHAGWRGVTAGVIPALLDAMRSAGLSPVRAGIGPSIGPCCYEVGEDVLSGARAVRCGDDLGDHEPGSVVSGGIDPQRTRGVAVG